MQAALPDINNRLIKHTNEIYRALREENYPQVAISIEACNALLPDDYRLEINTAKYEELVKGIKTTECPSCHTEIPDEDVKAYDKLLNNNMRLLLGSSFLKVWKCPKCDNANSYYDSKKYLTVKDKHDFFKVIPEPPSRYGLYDRVGRGYKWKEWVDICFKELERQISLYRTEYAAQNMAGDVVEDSGNQDGD